VLRQLVNRNPYLARLEEGGFHIDFINGYFVLYGVPYLDGALDLCHGDLVSKVELSGDFVIDRPADHQVFFRGGRPHGLDGNPIGLAGGENRVTVAEDFITDRSFSRKPAAGYETFEEKIDAYIQFLTAPALERYPDASPRRGIELKAAEVDSPLKFPDTMSSKGAIVDYALLLQNKHVAVIGAGGTGSYIIDFLAKTHLRKISLYDYDVVHVHTLFRMPCSGSKADLGKPKAQIVAERYAKFHGGIEWERERISKDSSDRFTPVDFAFVAIDDGPSRGEVCEMLATKGIPFIDVGMGLYRTSTGLNGVIRTSRVRPDELGDFLNSPDLPTENPPDNEYRHQPQIAELNALNAALAVYKFKQFLGFFQEFHSHDVDLFELANAEMLRERWRG
jgi:hypothetical protein